MPRENMRYKNWKGSQLENKFSHWIWRQYASAFWDDVRLDRVLPHKPARDVNDERHVHPLQLDVIERAAILWSNPNEVILSPFAGVGSELYGALELDRKAIGIELKISYYNQAKRNIEYLMSRPKDNADAQLALFDLDDPLEAPEINDDETDLDTPAAAGHDSENTPTV